MRGFRFPLAICGAAALLLSGCAASAKKDAGVEEVRSDVLHRIDGRVQKSDAPDAHLAAIDPLLTPASAAQLALGNNPRVQIALEDLGIARADALKAVTLDNPRLSSSVQWATHGGGYMADFGIGQNLQKLLLMASNKRFSKVQFEEAQLRATREILTVAGDAQMEFFAAVAARHSAQMNRMIADAATASFDFATQLYDAGNLSELELERERGMAEEAHTRLADSDLETSRTQGALWRTLGLSDQSGARFALPDELPPMPAQEADLRNIEPYSVEHSLDLAIHKKQVDAMTQALGLTRDWRWLGEVEIGALAERERDQTWMIGPSLNIDIPIFGRSRAAIDREQAMLRQRELELIDAAIGLRTDVRLSAEQLAADREKTTRYLNVIIPNREKIVKLNMQQYNYMLIGVQDVLTARQDEYRAYREYIAALRDYWTTRASLSLIAGGRLPSTDNPEAAK